jgi:diadenylate cyclase
MFIAVSTWIVYPVEIALIYGGLLIVYRFVKGSTGDSAIKGFFVLFIFLAFLAYFISQQFELFRIRALITGVKDVLLIATIVIFQPELRRAVVSLGRRRFVTRGEDGSLGAVDAVTEAAFRLSKEKTGALLAFERENGLSDVAREGTEVDAAVTPELIAAIFTPGGPLHDGGMIIRGGRIVAAGALFPLTERSELAKRLGTRHRAAIGISEESDCVCVVVSEETGNVSVAVGGELREKLDREEFTRYLSVKLRGAGSGRLKATEARA